MRKKQLQKHAFGLKMREKNTRKGRMDVERSGGVLMHISSLYGDYGCGTFGKSAYEFVDFLKESGFTYWQVLPFGLTDAYHSPYMSVSSFGGNPLFVDPGILFEKGLVTREERDAQRICAPYLCEYESVREGRMDFLARAARRFGETAESRAFFKNHPYIEDFCVFMAKKAANGEKNCAFWTRGDYAQENADLWKFVQYAFYTQWQDLHRYANENGIKIIGDLPFYVSDHSHDLDRFPDAFARGADGKIHDVAGVPPDYFSAEGQKWGNPLYDWDAMEKEGYRYWRARLGHTLELFDGVRIDHFRALSSYWAVPAEDETAVGGEMRKGPGKKMIDVIREVAGDKLIIAENLGLIDDDVNDLLAYSGFPGMGVFQFGFDGNAANPHLPHNYTQNTVSYTGTHDNNTLLGFMWELDGETRKAVLDYIGFEGDNWDRSYDRIIRVMMISGAGIVIFPIQDLLGYGSDTRLNTPGRAEGNWRMRITKEQLDSIDRKRFLHLNRMYGRSGGK